MQTISKNEDEEGSSRRTDLIGIVVYTGRIGRCLEGKYTLEDLEAGILEYKTVREFLTDIRKEFRERDKESIKVAELRRLKQEGKTIEEFV